MFAVPCCRWVKIMSSSLNTTTCLMFTPAHQPLHTTGFDTNHCEILLLLLRSGSWVHEAVVFQGGCGNKYGILSLKNLATPVLPVRIVTRLPSLQACDAPEVLQRVQRHSWLLTGPAADIKILSSPNLNDIFLECRC